VFDLPERPLMVTEHQASNYRCGNCRGVTKAVFPDGVVAPGLEQRVPVPQWRFNLLAPFDPAANAIC